MVVIQLPIVFVLMCGMIAESGVVFSVGKAINMLIISPWYGNSIMLYHSSFGVLVVPKKKRIEMSHNSHSLKSIFRYLQLLESTRKPVPTPQKLILASQTACLPARQSFNKWYGKRCYLEKKPN
uniref:Uncharacterized protein n=1 Tax=Pavo cristatus TaxID=9049 RepID=A0A8C9EIZ7_PAVCR